jgi:hypothetical protein
MNKSKRIIPFWVWPYTWGTKGETRKRMEIEYYLEGADQKRELAKLKYSGKELEAAELDIAYNYGEISEYSLEIGKAELIEDELKRREKVIEIDYKHAMIDERGRDVRLAKLEGNDALREEKLLEVEYKYGDIGEKDYKKKLATIRKEPWVDVIVAGFSEENPTEGGFQLDWNDEFIEYLQNAGYLAPSEEETVNLWFSEVCKNIALDAFDGLGDINELLDEAEQKRKGSSHVTTVKIDDSRWSKG